MTACLTPDKLNVVAEKNSPNSVLSYLSALDEEQLRGMTDTSERVKMLMAAALLYKLIESKDSKDSPGRLQYKNKVEELETGLEEQEKNLVLLEQNNQKDRLEVARLEKEIEEVNQKNAIARAELEDLKKKEQAVSKNLRNARDLNRRLNVEYTKLSKVSCVIL